MTESAAYLVDRVLPRGTPYRQWVLSFPWSMRYRLAFNAALASDVLSAFMKVLMRWLRRCAEDDGVADPHPGAIVQIQRFGDGASANFHPHVLALEGVFHLTPDGEVRFHRTRAPRPEDVAAIVEQTERQVDRVLRRHGLLDLLADDDDEVPEGRQLLMRCAEARPSGRRSASAVSERLRPRGGWKSTPPGSGGSASTKDHSGRAPNGRDRSRERQKAKRLALCAQSTGGFNLHAATSVRARDRAGLERLLRYIGRSAIPEDRIRLLDDGTVAFQLKRPWKGDVEQLLFEPANFVARLAALVAPPRMNLLRYVGVFAPHHALRARVVPVPPKARADRPTAPPRPGRMSWADLMKRTWKVDIMKCDCGGTMQLISAIMKPDALEAICAALILSGHMTKHQRGPPGRPYVVYVLEGYEHLSPHRKMNETQRAQEQPSAA